MEGITYLTSLVRNIKFTARASSLSCHPERRAKPAVEPEGRCIASGSKEHYQRLALAKGELYRFPRSCSVAPRTAPRFDSACAPLRMTRVGAGFHSPSRARGAYRAHTVCISRGIPPMVRMLHIACAFRAHITASEARHITSLLPQKGKNNEGHG